MHNFSEALAALLRQAAEEPESVGRSNERWPAGIRLRRYAAGEYLAHTGQPLEAVMVQVEGKALVLKYTFEGGVARSGIAAAPQVYGLYELLNDIGEHTATLQAQEAVLCAEVPLPLYRQALQTSHPVALSSLNFLASFTNRMLNRNDRLALNTPGQNLLLYLYDACAGQPLPCVVRERKTHIAESLHINLRTLYRWLDRLEAQGIILRRGGKIVVDEPCYQRLGEALRYGVEM